MVPDKVEEGRTDDERRVRGCREMKKEPKQHDRLTSPRGTASTTKVDVVLKLRLLDHVHRVPDRAYSEPADGDQSRIPSCGLLDTVGVARRELHIDPRHRRRASLGGLPGVELGHRR